MSVKSPVRKAFSNAQKAPRHRPVFLLCYDIREPKRLQRAHRFVSKHALALQYSVFLITQKSKAIATFNWLKKHLPDEDDVRLYEVRSGQSLWLYGKGQAVAPQANQGRKGLLSWFAGLLKVE